MCRPAFDKKTVAGLSAPRYNGENKGGIGMAIRGIFLDLDGTTLNKEGRLSDGNRRALEYAIAQGTEIVIASGRSLNALPADICAVSGIRYAITSNGAAIYYLPSGACLCQYRLTGSAVEAVLRLLEGEDVVLEVFMDGQAYADAAYVSDPARFGAPERAIEYIKTSRIPQSDICAFIRAHAGELESMDIVVRDSVVKERIWERIRREIPEIYITSSVPRLLELSNCRSGKHNGMRFLREKLGLAAEETAAFGDADNDAEMLSEAGVGIAMANGTPGCIAAADRVTKHHDEDGVAEGIYELLGTVKTGW